MESAKGASRKARKPNSKRKATWLGSSHKRLWSKERILSISDGSESLMFPKAGAESRKHFARRSQHRKEPVPPVFQVCREENL